MSEASEDEVAALRQRVLAVHGAIAGLRAWTVYTAFLPSFTAAAYLLLMPRLVSDTSSISVVKGVLAFGFCVGAAAFTTAVTMVATSPLVAAYREHRRRSRYRDMAGLPRDRARQVLLPLHDVGGEVGPLVRDLTHDLRLGGEPTPADAPTGRGDEPTP